MQLANFVINPVCLLDEGHMSKYQSLSIELGSKKTHTIPQAVTAPRVPGTPRPATGATSPATSRATAPRAVAPLAPVVPRSSATR